MLERHGHKHALQNRTSFEKMVKSSFSRATIKLCGQTRSVQGYEPLAIRYIRQLGVRPEDIAVGNDPRLPSFYWVHKDGSRRVYHPDIYVVSKNLIIEVKSTYTYKSNLTKNRMKRDAVIAAGYNFKFFVADPKTGKPLNPNSI